MLEAVQSRLSWVEIIDESLHTKDGIGIGHINAVNHDFVVVNRGFVNVHYCCIPIRKVEGWDGKVLWIEATKEEVKKNYEALSCQSPGVILSRIVPGIQQLIQS